MWKYKRVVAGLMALTFALNVPTIKTYANIESKDTLLEEDFAKAKENQGVKSTIWVDGIDISDTDFHLFRNGSTAAYFVTKHRAGSGWYDINKSFDVRDRELCAGAVATNMFHWWLDRNKDYVDRYLAEDVSNATISIGDKKVDLRELNEVYEVEENGTYTDRSKFFDFIKATFSGSVWADKILDLYINGYSYSRRYAKNVKGVDKASSPMNFFNKIFGDNLLTNVYDNITTLEEFSDIIKSELESGKVIGMGYTGSIVAGHAVTLWGADFDENDKVVAVYISDSDDTDVKYDGSYIGLKRFRVKQVGDSVKISGYLEDNVGSRVSRIYPLESGKEYFEKYFENKDISINEKVIEDDKSKEDTIEDTKKEKNFVEESKKEEKVEILDKKDEEIVQEVSKPRGFSSGGGSSSSRGERKSKSFSKKDLKGNIEKSHLGIWKQDARGWWYQNEDKTYPKASFKRLLWNGREDWYYFDNDGYLVSAWKNINGKWYYFYPKTEGTNIYGSMAKNTIIDGYYIGVNGEANR